MQQSQPWLRIVDLSIKGPSKADPLSEGLVERLGAMGDADTEELGHGILVRGLTGGKGTEGL